MRRYYTVRLINGTSRTLSTEGSIRDVIARIRRSTPGFLKAEDGDYINSMHIVSVSRRPSA